MLAGQPAADRAHLRSHSGRNAGRVFTLVPTAKEYTVPAPHLRTLLLERLRLPLPAIEAFCEGCGGQLDPQGKHRASCPTSGRLKTRAAPIERMVARIYREAGARVRFNVMLRDMNLGVSARDTRRIEVLAQDLPCYGGAQLAVDVTLRSALTTGGEAHPHAADVDGAVLEQAREDKETTYPEFHESRRCRLVVMGIETGGRWSDEAASVVWELATAKAREAPGFMRKAVALGWERRWTGLLSSACSVAFAASLTEPKASLHFACAAGGEAPALADLLQR